MKYDLTSPAVVRDLLKKYRLWQKKRLGQHFLVDRTALSTMVESADLQPTDTVLEIGPGHGVLTCELLPRVARVMAVEIDADIMPVLRETTRFFSDRLEVYQGHILGAPLPEGEYKVVSNVPYQVTTPILHKFLYECEHRPTSMTLLVQKEVAQKLTETRKPTQYAILTQLYAQAEYIADVPMGSFFPPPKVESAIVHLQIRPEPLVTGDLTKLTKIIKHGFRSSRKKLSNIFPPQVIEQAGLDPELRPSHLTVEDWGRLCDASA